MAMSLLLAVASLTPSLGLEVRPAQLPENVFDRRAHLFINFAGTSVHLLFICARISHAPYITMVRSGVALVCWGCSRGGWHPFDFSALALATPDDGAVQSKAAYDYYGLMVCHLRYSSLCPPKMNLLRPLPLSASSG